MNKITTVLDDMCKKNINKNFHFVAAFLLLFVNVFMSVAVWSGASLAVSSFFSRVAMADTQGIVAVVNDDVITGGDLSKRIHLVMTSSELPNTQEIRQKLVQQVLGNLINEQIMLQEAEKYSYKVEQEEINKGLAQVAQQNNMTIDQFKATLLRLKVDLSTMHRQIEAQLAWGKVVQSRYRPQIVISKRDVEDTLERIRSKIGTTEYLAAEIYLPVDSASNEELVKKLVNELAYEIRAGKASFSKLAQQFSQAAGAMNGGNKGWVNEAQLSEDLLQALRPLKKNQITSPIRTISGYHIFTIHDKRILSEDTIPSSEQVKFNIGTERMDKLQRQRLMDLRLVSYVDVRL